VTYTLPALKVVKDQCPTTRELFEWSLGNDGIKLSHEALNAIGQARRALIEESKKRTVYGFHTRLGKLYDSGRLSDPSYEETVIKEHAVGTGPILPPQIGRLTLAIRIIQLSRGFTGVRPETVERLLKPLECGLSPAIPSRGSVGASGDLAPAAHMINQFLLGNEMVWVNGKLVDAEKALEGCGLGKWTLERGEALLLINTTAYSTALLLYSLGITERLIGKIIDAAVEIGRILGANCEHWTPVISEAKIHEGLDEALQALSEKCSGEPRRLQDPYSLRCLPNIIGAAINGIHYIERIIANETCSSSSNPIVTSKGVIHQCGFHAVYPSLAADHLALLNAWLGNLTERLANKLMDESYTGLPKFLAHSKSSVGGMIIHYTIASIAAELRADSAPRSVHNIPTSLDHEDLVSMAPNSGLRLLRMASRLIESIYLLEALADIAKKLETGELPEIDVIYKEKTISAIKLKQFYGLDNII
jgi:histidine ammonia-lyase